MKPNQSIIATEPSAARLLIDPGLIHARRGFSIERAARPAMMAPSSPMPKLAKTLVSQRELVNSNSEKLIRVRLRALEIPPIKDGLVIGRDAAIGGEAMLRTLRLMTHEKFERISLKEEIIQEVIVRSSVLKKLGRERLIAFVLGRIKPVMADTELLMLDIEVELVIETPFSGGAMTSAKQLLTARVVEGMADERLINVAGRLRARQAQHCVVLSAPGQFLGLVSLAEIASRTNAGQRILADLVSEIPALILGEDDPAAAILDLFEKRGSQEAIVVRADQSYLGLITAESLFGWMHSEQRAARQALEDVMAERLALSHDVRSPLRTIQGYADILASGEHGALDPTGLGCAQSIKRSAGRLELLADDILAKARRSAAAGSPAAEAVDLNLVLDDAVEFHRALFAERGAVLRKRGQLHRAAGRYAPVLQIVSNLIANAVAYGRPGRQPLVEVWTEDSADTIKLRIKDNGRGIAPAEARRLFTPFERGASTDRAGFGLGLTIAKRAADETRAVIALETAGDDGSVFLVTFRRVPSDT